MLYSIVGIIVIILDQLVKLWVDNNIHSLEEIRQLIPGVVSLVRVQNDGAAFSFLSGGGARIWFILITAVFAILVVIALATNFISGRFGRWCLVFVTAGGLSNMIDRVRYGYVLDMFKVDLFNFAVFNVADIFITVFCIAFIIYILFGGEKELEDDADEFDERDYEYDDRPRREKPQKRSRYPEEYDYAEDEAPARRTRAKVHDEESEPQPKKKSSSRPAKAVKSRRVEEAEAPVKQRRSRDTVEAERPAKRNAHADMFDEMFAAEEASKRTVQKAEKPARPAQPRAEASAETRRPAPRPAVQKAAEMPAFDSSDPFAEWEQANARARSGLENGSTAQAMGAAKRTPEVTRVEVPAERKPAEPVFDDLDLDAILNEFK